jgi:hypothetical protein
METFIIKTIDGAEFAISRERMMNIIAAHDAGEKRIFLDGAWLNVNTFNIYPAGALPQTEGYLNDGTRVIKKFGQWVDARNPEVRLDPHYYPEIAQDRVMSRAEYENRNVGQLAAPQATPELPHYRQNTQPMEMSGILEEREGMDSV